MLQRELIVTEQADLHLVWWGNHIFVKPLPGFLLNYNFFKDNLCSSMDLYTDACGLLYSYTQLVRHESDLKIAVELGLLSKDTEWDQWLEFSREIRRTVKPDTFPESNRRYQYGELRLGRLNLIYRFFCGRWRRGYHNTYTDYGSFFQSNFAWALCVFAYTSVVLSTLQLGLAAKRAVVQPDPQSRSLGSHSYRFSVAVLVVVGGVVAVIISWFVVVFVISLVYTLIHEARMGGRRRRAAGVGAGVV